MITKKDSGYKALSRVLKVLSVETRVRIVELLKSRALCVNALAKRLDVTPGAVSQHLRVMRDAGLVVDERRGYHVHYRLNEETLAQWRMDIDALLGPVANSELETEKQGDRSCAAMTKPKDAGNRRI